MGKQCIPFYEAKLIHHHYSLLQCLGKAQIVDISSPELLMVQKFC